MHVVHPETGSQAGNGAEAEVEDRLTISRPIDTLPIITACDSLDKEHNDNNMRIDGTAADADYSQPTCEHPTSICPSFVGTSPGAIPQQLSTTLSSGAFEYSDLSIFNSTTVTN
jgi:hypothetical protein